MTYRLGTAVLAAAFLSAPLCAFAGGAAGEARGVAADPNRFDGALARPDAAPVRAGTPGDRRTAEQIAADEQALANARRPNLTVANGADKEIEPPKPNEWLKSDHIIMGVKGAMIGLLVGSLWGLTGLGIGVLVGGLIGYGLSRLTA